MEEDIIAEAFAGMRDEESQGSQPQEEAKPEETPAEPVAPAVPEAAKEAPFHKNPRWRAMQEQLRSEKSEREKLAAELAEFRKSRQPEAQAPKPSEAVPENMRVIFGENYAAYRVWADEQRSAARAEIAEWQRAQDEQRRQAEDARTEFVSRSEEALRAIGEENGIDLSDRDGTVRNQILDVVEQYGIVGADGNPDFAKAWALHQRLYPPTDSAEKADRKKVAANAAAPASGAPGTPDAEVMTRSRLKTKKLSDFFN